MRGCTSKCGGTHEMAAPVQTTVVAALKPHGETVLLALLSRQWQNTPNSRRSLASGNIQATAAVAANANGMQRVSSYSTCLPGAKRSGYQLGQRK